MYDIFKEPFLLEEFCQAIRERHGPTEFHLKYPNIWFSLSENEKTLINKKGMEFWEKNKQFNEEMKELLK